MKRLGITTKLTLIQLVSLSIVGLASYFAGQSLLSQVASLAQDDQIFTALSQGQKAIIEWNRERQNRVEPLINACVAQDPRLRRCSVEGANITIEAQETSGVALPGWITENTYLAVTEAGEFHVTFDWQPLKPQYTSLRDLLATRDHVQTVLPELTRSFSLVFLMALVGSSLLAAGFTIFISKGLTQRVARLIEYTSVLGQGKFTTAPVATAGNDEIGLLALSLETMAKDLESAKARLVLAEKMTSWQNVARKVAHEIKNPLTPISLVAEELERRSAVDDPALSEFLIESSRIIQEETASLQRMVKEFTAFARLPEAELEPADLAAVVQDYVKRNAFNDSATNPVLIVKSDPKETYPTLCDRSMIHQVLHNLVNNARLAKHPKQVQIAMRLSLDQECVHLLIEDDGPGIPEEINANLFDAYVTSRSTGDQEKGMGLGLAISRKIAYDHSGSLSLVQTGKKGTTFKLSLPRKESSAHA